MLRTTPLLRQSLTSVSSTRTAAAAALTPLARNQTTRQVRCAHAISNPTLANIEKRWEAMPPQEQADLWMALRDRMKVDWNELTVQEKKAAYWIAFGPHGPRAQTPPGENAKVLIYTVVGLLAAGLLFGFTRYFAREKPRTLNKEWQEASNEYFKENRIEPITFIGGEDYKGKGLVQSPPKGKDE